MNESVRHKAKEWTEPNCGCNWNSTKSLAVKSACHGGLQSNNFCWIGGSGQPFGQITEFVRTQLPVAGQLECVLNHFGLFLRRQVVHFLNEFGRCHRANFSRRKAEFQVASEHQSRRAIRSTTRRC